MSKTLSIFLTLILSTTILSASIQCTSEIEQTTSGDLVTTVEAYPTTIMVPDDYPTIQEAINAASPGDTIYVKEGIYYENVVVNKSVSFIGENRSTTIIDGSWRTGFHVILDNVNISGFTIRNCGPPEGGPFGGIHLDSSNNCKISGNRINNNYMGIWLNGGSSNFIFNNTLSNCSYAIGGPFVSGNNLNIFNNFMADNRFGIYLDASSNSTISNNTILNSAGLSVYLQYCHNIILNNNNMTGNVYSLRVLGASLSQFIHDIDVSNTVDGKPIYYLINQRNLIIDPLAFADVGYLGLVNSTFIMIKNLNLTRSGQGLLLSYTTHSTVMHVNISFSSHGVEFFRSSYNTIMDSTITSNRYSGIELNYDCNGNNISNNTISSNGEDAISLVWSDGNIIKYNTLSKNGNGNNISNNTISSNGVDAISMVWSDGNIIKYNTLSKNDYGMRLHSCHSNTIHHNNFIDNREQVSFFQSANTWDSGYPSGGNYWSDYSTRYPDAQELDDSGIWDTPYVIDEYNQDNYPLMEPWSPPPSILGDLNNDGSVDISDIIIAGKAFASCPGHLRWDYRADINNDDVVDIFDLILIAINFGKTI